MEKKQLLLQEPQGDRVGTSQRLAHTGYHVLGIARTKPEETFLATDGFFSAGKGDGERVDDGYKGKGVTTHLFIALLLRRLSPSTALCHCFSTHSLFLMHLFF